MTATREERAAVERVLAAGCPLCERKPGTLRDRVGWVAAVLLLAAVVVSLLAVAAWAVAAVVAGR